VPLPHGTSATFLPGLSLVDYIMNDGRPLAEAFPAH
jgi:hypothetical protein